MTIYAVTDAQGAVIEFQDLRGSSEPSAGMRPATDAELAEIAATKPQAPLTPRVWLERLSPETQGAITAAAAKDTSGALLLWLMKASGASVIDVTNPETVAGVGALVSLGIITTADQSTLLAP